MTTKAPWTPEQVENLRRFQNSNNFHPFTCPGTHHGGCPQRELIPTVDGFVCGCGEYVQDWAHDHMLNHTAEVEASFVRASYQAFRVNSDES